jgi:flagellar hook assembly protein FlgD
LQQFRSYPNPFGGQATIKFSIPKAEHVRVAVYDVRGRLVRTIIDKSMTPGLHSTMWNGEDNYGRQVASGLYFCRFKAGDFVATRKMVMLR